MTSQAEDGDARAGTAWFYDIFQTWAVDIEYFLSLTSPSESVLELGCGTGRVLVALAERVPRVVGVDHSAEMLLACRRKLSLLQLSHRATLVEGDIARVRLRECFHRVIAPFHVFQNLAEDAAVDGMFETVRAHLLPGGTATLTAIAPSAQPDDFLAQMRRRASRRLVGQAFVDNCVVRRYETLVEISKSPLVVWVKQEYEQALPGRVLRCGGMVHAMRMWYPDELLKKVDKMGFSVAHAEGGYNAEPFGRGGTLIVHLQAR